ncbi:MAG TPA: hypothetical protein PLE77_14795 [Kiritimatiellia bacterium]|nr:hypothetical protein [Kiritimatiellia bacterium]
MRRFWIRVISLVLVPALLLCFVPAAQAGSYATDDSDNGESSDGAIITVGLLAVVIGVLFIIGMKADWDNVFGKATPRTTPEEREQLRRDIALAIDGGYADEVVPVLEANSGSGSQGTAGLRIKF